MTPEQIRNSWDDDEPSDPEAARGAILPASDAAGGYADADVLRGRIAALEAVSAENERLRATVVRVRALADAFADDGLQRYGGNVAWHIEEAIANEKGDFPDAADRRIASQRERADAAEAKLRDVEALADEANRLAVTYWAQDSTYLTHATVWSDVTHRLRAVLARSQAPQAPAEQEGPPDPECLNHAHIPWNNFCAPSVRPATADDEGVRHG